MSFEQLTLHKQLQTALQHQGFEAPTPIQLQAIPHANAGRDVMASSKTGSGKTLAFLLPAIQRVLTKKALSKRDPRVLVLTPTRELANQVYAQLKMLVAGTMIKTAKVLGGDNYNDQVKALRKDPQVIVATPGRLADHLEKRSFYLNGLELLILDEADRMLDLGFTDALNAINGAADHRQRQTLMFSATLEHADINLLSKSILNSPQRITVGSETEQHSDISQSFYLADHVEHKESLLKYFVNQDDTKQIIVFTATRKDTDRLAVTLQKENIKAEGLSGDLPQSKRLEMMDNFSRGQFEVLITTDVASRGLDLLNVSHVINFDMPKHAEEYVHRIGRTGRAGFSGFAISFVGPKDWQSYTRVKSYLNISDSFSTVEGLAATFAGPKPSKRQPNKPTKAKEASKKKVADKKSHQQNKTKVPRKPKKVVLPDFAQDEGFTPMRKKKQ
ncbi:DEAD/DEAH box helicase [Flocculibacter collagenilyticus]|uniref:DEAD/DEAH box helicase n=1 Tax=Flocculibacter collagenilyticus TaxID=2744479 RepID=UPI001F21E76D|nr:DEAD/DEAH box helicase [Flocculibacter collagenilyticus]